MVVPGRSAQGNPRGRFNPSDPLEGSVGAFSPDIPQQPWPDHVRYRLAVVFPGMLATPMVHIALEGRPAGWMAVQQDPETIAFQPVGEAQPLGWLRGSTAIVPMSTDNPSLMGAFDASGLLLGRMSGLLSRTQGVAAPDGGRLLMLQGVHRSILGQDQWRYAVTHPWKKKWVRTSKPDREEVVGFLSGLRAVPWVSVGIGPVRVMPQMFDTMQGQLLLDLHKEYNPLLAVLLLIRTNILDDFHRAQRGFRR